MRVLVEVSHYSEVSDQIFEGCKWFLMNDKVFNYLLNKEGVVLLLNERRFYEHYKSLGNNVHFLEEGSEYSHVLISHPSSYQYLEKLVDMHLGKAKIIVADGDFKLRNPDRLRDDVDLYVTNIEWMAGPKSLYLPILWYKDNHPPTGDVLSYGRLAATGNLVVKVKTVYKRRLEMFSELLNDPRVDFYGRMPHLPEADAKYVDIRTNNFDVTFYDLDLSHLVGFQATTPRLSELINRSNITLLPRGNKILDALDFPDELRYDYLSTSSLLSAFDASSKYDRLVNESLIEQLSPYYNQVGDELSRYGIL